MSARTSASLTGAGGLQIFRQAWRPDPAATPTPRGAVVLVHGAGEHSDRYDHVAERLADAGWAVHALDHRGHGRSQGPRALIDRVTNAVADLDALVTIAGGDAGGGGDAAAGDTGSARALPVFMLGHSLGGMLAVAYALEHASRLDGLVLSGALADVEAPAALLAVGRLLSRIAPRTPLIAIDPALVSRDPAVVAAYRADPLVHHGRLPARTAAEIVATVSAFPERVKAITLPTLVLYGTADRLCPPAGSVMLAERLGSGDVTVRAYDGLYHEILNEPERETVIDDILAWLAGHERAAARR